MGSESLAYLKTGSGSIHCPPPGDHLFHLGEDVPAYFDLDKATFFDPKTETCFDDKHSDRANWPIFLAQTVERV